MSAKKLIEVSIYIIEYFRAKILVLQKRKFSFFHLRALTTSMMVPPVLRRSFEKIFKSRTKLQNIRKTVYKNKTEQYYKYFVRFPKSQKASEKWRSVPAIYHKTYWRPTKFIDTFFYKWHFQCKRKALNFRTLLFWENSDYFILTAFFNFDLLETSKKILWSLNSTR